MAGYEPLRRIVGDDLFAMWRGVRSGDRSICLLKVPRSHPPRDHQVEFLERDRELRSTLDLPGVPRLIEVAEHNGAPCLVLEDKGGLPVSMLDGLRGDLVRFLTTAQRLAGLVGDLHRQNITLRSLTADSILVDVSTGDVSLIDLSLAARDSEGEMGRLPLHLLSRRLAYVAPEQTGRTNQVSDHRGDLYALGVILYELLIGRPPFVFEDPLEMIHAHLALQPTPPHEIDPAMPEMISMILMKLLAKTPEERYWTAGGLREDLATCATQWSASQCIEGFALARSDRPDRFMISRKLYGRSRSVERLRSAFEAAAAGPSSLFLVSGYSGSGKTTLIQQLYKPVIRQRGVFAWGKCDQVTRSRPYGVFLQAFRGLVDCMLAQSDENVARWRTRLEEALGANLAVLVEVVPEIRWVVGEQPPAPTLAPGEAQNRFRSVIRAFVSTMTRPDQPVVIFLDDLHWSDPATLDLLEALVTDTETRFLLIIGAYRDNEVDTEHPLTHALRRLQTARARTESLSLRSLGDDDLAQLLADTLAADLERVQPLASLVHAKTGGNPFYVGQFLEALHREGLIWFDEDQRGWQFAIDAIRDSPFTDNVADLVGRRIRQMPLETQQVLGLAACIGHTVDLDLLASTAAVPVPVAIRNLNPAVAEGVLLVASHDYDSVGGKTPSARYSFLHDRVQQAAYSLMTETDRIQAHARVGRLLRERWGEAPPDDGLFVLAHHLDLGRSDSMQPEELLSAARVQLMASRRAKSAAAYRASLAYARAGLAALGEQTWTTAPELAWELHLEAAESQYLCGAFEEAEQCFELLLARAPRPKKAEVYCLMTRQYENMSRFEDALQATRDGLASFDLALPDSGPEREASLAIEVKRIEKVRAGRRIESLVDLPPMEDPGLRSVMRLLMTAWAPTYLSGHADLTRLISALMVRLSLEHGNTEESAYGYVTHAITVGPVFGDYEAAYEWGRLALAANERFDDRRLRAKVHQQFQAHVNLWRRPIDTCIPHAREARRAGLEAGDYTYAGYGAFTESWPGLLRCNHLAGFVIEQMPNLELLERIQMSGLAQIERAILSFARALQGRTESPTSLSSDDFDEEGYESTFSGQGFFMAVLSILRVWLALFFDVPEVARARVPELRTHLSSAQGTMWMVIGRYLEGLVLARDGGHPARLADIHASLVMLGSNAPENWNGFAWLVEAERHRLAGSDREAMLRYEDAIAHAHQWGHPGQAGLACETCARFCRDVGNHGLELRYLREAMALYEKWGASAKVEQLRHAHPDLRPTAPVRAAQLGRASWDVPDSGIDVATFAKLANTIAGEIVLEDLLRKLVRIAIENAGAERGLFLREETGRFQLEAEGRVDGKSVTLPGSSDGDRFSIAVANYVRKTRRSLVLGDATDDDRFASDPYVIQKRPRSILGVPILLQGRSLGLIYLENNLGPDAFTQDRVRVLEILTGQIAIALENARLYEEMRQEVERRSAAEEDLRVAVEDLQKLQTRLQAENAYLREEVHHGFDEIVGDSPAMRALLASIERVSPTAATVLILGETGTGKELVARAIHHLSPRRDRPMTRINCGAIPAGLVESELFGHVQGAFTGAIEPRLGRFELADGGTIFLDEVGELPLDTQVKLLRVLQEREFEPIGSDRTVRVDVRVIAATNRDLQEAVSEGRFRSDLYYRLNVVPIRLPPLRERAGDIPMLVTHFVDRASRATGRMVERIPGELMERLEAYSWPGNVRELQNLMERAVILSTGSVLELDPALLTPSDGARPSAPAPAASVGRAHAELPTLEESERQLILDALVRSGGVIEGPKGAAHLLAIHPNTLRSRMKRLGIGRKEAAKREGSAF